MNVQHIKERLINIQESVEEYRILMDSQGFMFNKDVHKKINVLHIKVDGLDENTILRDVSMFVFLLNLWEKELQEIEKELIPYLSV